MLFTYSEMPLGIIVACVPLLGKIVFPKRGGSSGKSKQRGPPWQDRLNDTTTARTHLRHTKAGIPADRQFRTLSEEYEHCVGDQDMIPVTINSEPKASHGVDQPVPKSTAND